MSYSNPIDPTSGQTLTAAYVKTYITDNIKETAPAKAVAQGDIFYATGLNAIARLAKSADYAGGLQIVGNVPSWSLQGERQKAKSANLIAAVVSSLTSVADVSNATVTLTTAGGLLKVELVPDLTLSTGFYFLVSNANGANQVTVYLNVDGTDVGAVYLGVGSTTVSAYVVMPPMYAAVAAGSHTVKLRWAAFVGGSHIDVTLAGARLQVTEETRTTY